MLDASRRIAPCKRIGTCKRIAPHASVLPSVPPIPGIGMGIGMDTSIGNGIGMNHQPGIGMNLSLDVTHFRPIRGREIISDRHIHRESTYRQALLLYCLIHFGGSSGAAQGHLVGSWMEDDL